MSSADDPGADPKNPGSSQVPGRQVHTQLVEALVHVLVEKGVLTKNDALNVVQTVAHVKLGETVEPRRHSIRARLDLEMLEAMYRSFESLTDRPGVVLADGANVRRLRPPIHGDHPKFPRDD